MSRRDHERAAHPVRHVVRALCGLTLLCAFGGGALHCAGGGSARTSRSGLAVSPGRGVALRAAVYMDGAAVAGQLARLGPPTVGPTDPNAGPANFTTGPKKVLVILMQITGQPAPGSAAAIRDIVFTAPNSANAFLREESFGQLSLTGRLRTDGDVYGPYVVPVGQKPDICDSVNWSTAAAHQFAAATGQNPDSWDNVIFVFESSACTFSGEGEIGDLAAPGARHVWANAILTGGVPTTSVIAHELGHNFGVDHAGGLECSSGGVRISFSEACAGDANQRVNEYRDPFDVMGSGPRQESAYHKWESNWLAPSSVISVTRSGTYLISSEETVSTGLQLLELPRGAGLPSYWLDLRQPSGSFFDTFSAADPVVNGVSIRYANSSEMPHPAKSWLIDTTPSTTTFADAPLAVGATYTDGPRGVSIATLSVSGEGALVRITVPHGGDSSPPSGVSGLSATLAPDGLHLGWSPATDDSGVLQHYRVRRNGADFADVWVNGVLDPAPLPGSTTRYEITPIDPAGNVGPSSTIQVAIADTTAPSAPAGLAVTVRGAGAILTWSPSSDDVGVVAYEVDRDGVPIATGLQTTRLDDAQLGPGRHTYRVRSFDAADNASAFSVPVSIVLVGPAGAPPVVKVAQFKTVAAVKLKRLARHRVLLTWKATRGAHGYQVLRAGKRQRLLATTRRLRYIDGKAARGALRRSSYIVRAVLAP